MENFPTKMIGEFKWDGYNVRTLRFDGEIVSLLRGGRPNDKTRHMIMDFYGNKLTRFFDENPNFILWGEAYTKGDEKKVKTAIEILLISIIPNGSIWKDLYAFCTYLQS